MDADDLVAVVDCPSATIRRKEPRGFEISDLLVAPKAINSTASPPRSVRIVLAVADRPR